MRNWIVKLWKRARHSIAARLYASNVASLTAVAVLVIASIHFANGTKTAASYLYQSGVLDLQNESKFEILFQQHLRLVQAAPAELDRARLQTSKSELDRINHAIKEFLEQETDNGPSVTDEFIQPIRSELPGLNSAAELVFMLADNFAQDRALQVSQGEYADAARRIEGNLKNWRKAQLGLIDRELGRLADAAKTLTVWVTLSALATFALIGPIGLLIKYRTITRLGALTTVMLRLSKNDTTTTIPFITSQDEMGDLARAVLVFKNNAIALSDAHLYLDAAVNNMTQGLCMFDGSYSLLLCNDRFLAIYGLSREIVQPGMPLEKLFKYTAKLEGHQKRSAQELYNEYCDRIGKNDSFSYQRRLIDERVIAVSHQKMQGIGWLDTHEDITERLNSEKQITRLALYDSLTDLPNRFQFKRELDRTLEICGSSRFAVHCLDLDGFKSINDTLGHPAGDDLLGQVARRMTACVGEQGFVSRLGGDEFAVLQPNLENREAAAKLAGDIIAAINESYELDGHQAIVGGSIGISIFPDDGLDANQLLKNADLAMYGAKATGRGTLCFFESEMDARMKARRLLEFDLWKAVEEEAFEVYYQPVVDAISTEVKSFEALLRWRHPTRGMVPPSEFIPVAEEAGLIVRLGEWVLRHACAEATSWPGRIGVAVNLSPIQFRDPEFVNVVFSALASSHLDPARLELEITETVLLQDSRGVLDTLHKLKSFGVRISMDDFGTGYSSLSYLRSFPFDKIKIDQCFVRGLGDASDSLAIVRAVTGLGADLGMITLAEGVETQGELDILRNEKCNQIQGYFFSPAVPPQAIPELLNRLGKKLAEVA